MSWVPERPKTVIPEGLPDLPDAFQYVWLDDENEGCFQHHYTPSTPKRDGTYSIPIYTEQQMFEYAARAMAAMVPEKIKEPYRVFYTTDSNGRPTIKAEPCETGDWSKDKALAWLAGVKA